jgi:hypothetical protein
MYDPTRHVATNTQTQYLCGEGPSKNVILKDSLFQSPCIINRHTAKYFGYFLTYRLLLGALV